MIYHITSKNWWEGFSNQPFFSSPDLHREGFIHCSTNEQVAATLQRYYANQKELLLLHIDPTLLTAELKYEAATDGQLFPHVYGNINKDAIVNIVEIS